METKDCLAVTKIILLNILLSSFNLVTTFVNIHYLNNQGAVGFGLFSLFLLWFPGIITSVGFLVLYFRGNRSVSELDTWKLVVFPLTLLLIYPVLPIILSFFYLYSRDPKVFERARIARMFAAFLDHGPQFVLRLVIVVLNGLAHGGSYHRDDVVFILSMISTFLSLVLSALMFNERQSRRVTWLFLSGPMFAAIFGCRAFTLAVFIRETAQEDVGVSRQLLCLIIIALMFLANLAIFRWCGQDWTRSSVFGVSSMLLPVGYSNDNHFYQLPQQDLVIEQEIYQIAPRMRRDGPRNDDVIPVEIENQLTPEPDRITLAPMKSGRFLLVHIIINTALLSTCAIYIYASSTLSQEADDALMIPQILAVIPGLLFAVGRSFLYNDICPVYEDDATRIERANSYCIRGARIALSVLFCVLGFASLIPGIFWTVVYKVFTADDIKEAVYNGLTDEEDD